MPDYFPDVKSFYDLIRVPEFSTIIVKYGDSPVEQRVARLDTPIHRFVMNFPFLTAAEADTIFAFFLARKGPYEAFYLSNQEEAYRGVIWAANTSYSSGAIVRPPTINGRSYKCTTAGTTGATQPSWPTTYHGTVANGTTVWTENSYLVRFAQDALDMRYFQHSLYDMGQIELIEVAA